MPMQSKNGQKYYSILVGSSNEHLQNQRESVITQHNYNKRRQSETPPNKKNGFPNFRFCLLGGRGGVY